MEDVDWFLAHFSTPEIVRGQGFPAPDGIEGAREELARYVVDLFAQREGLRWGISIRDRAGLIGSAGLYDWDREVGSAELGYDLAPAHWGRGIMTETLRAILAYGFTTMELNRVQVLVMPRNERSLRLAEGLGFVREGVLRDHGVDETGTVCDDVVLSLLRREWRAAAVR
jgi:ribosomal-protein-alanine N-acetyltransferase